MRLTAVGAHTSPGQWQLIRPSCVSVQSSALPSPWLPATRSCEPGSRSTCSGRPSALHPQRTGAITSSCKSRSEAMLLPVASLTEGTT